MDMNDPATERQRPAIKIERFWTDYEPDPASPGKQRSIDWVQWIKIGDQHQSTISDKVARLRGGERKGADGSMKFYPPDIVWQAIGPAYEAWKKNETIPVDGTPLEAWPGVTHELLRVCKGANMLSVEDVAAMTESTMQRIGIPNIRGIKAKAQAFLDAQRDTAKIEAVLVEDRATIARQASELEELKAMIEQLSAQNGGEIRRGPGRPPKQPQAE
jgi:hypothetical protein